MLIKKTLQRIGSVKTLFLLFMSLVILTLSLPLLVAGITLIDRITYELGSEILTSKLDSLIRPLDLRYAKLKQIGLEDSREHLEEIRLAGLKRFAGYTYKETGSVFVVSGSGEIWLSKEFEGSGATVRQAFVNRVQSVRLGMVEYEAAGDIKLAAVQYYPPWQSYIGLSISQAELYAPRTLFVQINLAVLLVVCGLGFMAMLALNGLLIKPLIRLTDYAAAISGEEYDATIQGSFYLELAILKRAVAEMVSSIKQKIQETSLQLVTIRAREAERDLALEELQESEMRLQSLLNNTTTVVHIKDLDGRYLKVNRRFEEVFGVSAAELRDKTLFDICPEEVARQLGEHDRLVMERDCALEFEENVPHADGVHTYLSVKFPLHDAAGEIYGVGCVATDITERNKAVAALAEEQERLHVTLHSIGDGVITTDTEGRVVLLNKVAEALTGWPQEEAHGRPLEEVFNIVNEESRQRCENPVAKVMRTGEIVWLSNHTMLLARDGNEYSIADSGAPIKDRNDRIIGVVLVFRDVTEKSRLQEELIKAKKLESVGVLAGGIAHDFNNILAAILGNISLALASTDDIGQLRKLLQEAEKATLRARGLTQQLLTFSKGGAPVREVASIEGIVRDSADFILRGSNIACHYRFPEDLWLVDVDINQISQVVQNIIINAAQVMPKGGRIEISGENFVNRGAIPREQERFVKIAILDSGPGIPPEVIERIFDPYFTTKENGSGLGLAVTHSIITKHGGYIRVENSGAGARFIFYLPASERQAPARREAEESAPQPGSGRVLIMDDEEMIRNFVSATLSHFGFDVVSAADGEAAVQLYRQGLERGELIDLVIMDLTIPGGMGGEEAMRQILQLHPEAKGMVSSGYSNDPIMADCTAHGFRAAIMKPYRLNELVNLVRQVIQTGSGAPGSQGQSAH